MIKSQDLFSLRLLISGEKKQWIKHGVNVEGFPNASFLTVLSPVMLKLICYFKLCCKHIPFSKGFYFVIKKNKYELQYCSVIKWGCDIVKQSFYTNARPVEATFVWWPIHKIEAMFLFYYFFLGGGHTIACVSTYNTVCSDFFLSPQTSVCLILADHSIRFLFK